ncbi:MAG: IS1 family transposase [Taibaiella sp.]|nr:IS1 family transposase [Taibaiella sp.]
MCPYCFSHCINHGSSSSGNKRYRCKSCKRTHSKVYTLNACKQSIAEKVTSLLKEGCGIRSIGRILRISAVTVLRKIKAIAKQLKKPLISFGKEYEMDELCTFVKRKSRKRWIVYAIRKDTKQVVDFTIGSRTNSTLKKVTDTLILSKAVKVFTDKLPNYRSFYRSLLPNSIHSTKYRGTNHIERKNLTLRTHLKRLSRRTICFSKNMVMLHACLMIYFFS